jgi:hypothetical protein
MKNLRNFRLKKLGFKKIGLKILSFNAFLLFASSLLVSNNACLSKTAERDLKQVASKISYFSCAVLNGYVNKVKEFIASGADVTEINETPTASTSLIYDALFIKDEIFRNKIVDMLLKEIIRDRYKSVRDDYLNRKNYRSKSEKPATVLEKSYSLGYFDIAEKLIEAGAHCDDSDDCDLNIFYSKVALNLLKNKSAVNSSSRA